MSTDLSGEDANDFDWISQAEAARIQGVSRQAIHKLVQGGRLKSKTVGGHLLVNRNDLKRFRPQQPGRPRSNESRNADRVKRLLSTIRPEDRLEIFRYLRSEFPIHPLETKLGLSAEVILEAIERSAELTVRMFRGVLAEAAFEIYVVNNLSGWENVQTPAGDPSASEDRFFDFSLKQGNNDPVRVQVKLQRSLKGGPWQSEKVPKRYRFGRGLYVVETQRTRKGENRKTKESTRPYRFGQFDILAVAMQPSTKDWGSFRYTVGNWLVPSTDDKALIEKYQPVAGEPNDDWTDDFETCVSWFREGRKKTIRTRVEQ